MVTVNGSKLKFVKISSCYLPAGLNLGEGLKQAGKMRLVQKIYLNQFITDMKA